MRVASLWFCLALSCFGLSTAGYAQFASHETSRTHATGIGAIALENEAGKGILTHTTSQAAPGIKVSVGYVNDTFNVKGDGFDVSLIQFGPSVAGVAPIAQNIFLGVSAAFIDLDTKSKYQYSSAGNSQRDEIFLVLVQKRTLAPI